jgi:hypothetical protein
MDLYKVTISKEEIKSLPQKEVLFFIQAGAALNEINILTKLLIISNKEVDGAIETKAQNSQTLFILSLLTGKLWECWMFFQKAYFQSKIAKDYDKLLPESAKEHLAELKNYFGKDNLIKKVRHKLAFHYDTDEVQKQMPDLIEDELPEFYLSEGQGNSFFYISDMIRMKIILEYTGKTKPLEALNTFFGEVLDTAKLFILFIHHCLVVVARNHNNWKIEKIEINDPPPINNVLLPYFVDKALI